MRSLHVLIIHRKDDNYRKLSGWWSYPVPEFTWETLSVSAEGFKVDLKDKEHSFDLIVMEDWIWGEVLNKRLPLAYVIVDSARSMGQWQKNAEQARYADLILVDSDDLARFILPAGRPVRRFAHAVNDQLFVPPVHKSVDVAFLCWPTPERRIVQQDLEAFCALRRYSFLTGTFPSLEYATRLSAARIVVHQPHVKHARSWRVFDVMSSGGCLVSPLIPFVSGDGIEAFRHYVAYPDGNLSKLHDAIDAFMSERWETISEDGYNLVMDRHTWNVRARELRQTLSETLGL